MPVMRPAWYSPRDGTKRERRSALRRRDLDPALAVAEGDVGDQFEAERPRVERDRCVLVADRTITRPTCVTGDMCFLLSGWYRLTPG